MKTLPTRIGRILASAAIIGLGAAAAAGPAAAAEKSSSSRIISGVAGFYIGAWRSSFTQETASQRMSLTSDVAPGFQGSLGVAIGPFSLEYTPTYYLAYLDRRDLVGKEQADDVSSWSLLAFNFGVRIPKIGLRPYAGAGLQHYDFRSGTDVSFSGKFVRGGVALNFVTDGLAHFELKAEYQRIFIDAGGAGSMPSSVTTRANLWALLLGVRVGG